LRRPSVFFALAAAGFVAALALWPLPLSAMKPPVPQYAPIQGDKRTDPA
jgi:hypothetical protein